MDKDSAFFAGLFDEGYVERVEDFMKIGQLSSLKDFLGYLYMIYPFDHQVTKECASWDLVVAMLRCSSPSTASPTENLMQTTQGFDHAIKV